MANPGSAVARCLLCCAFAASPNAALGEQAVLKIVAFGTSLTARGGWTGSLQAALSQCLDRPVSVAVVAQSGATSDWGVSAIDRVIAQAPDIVLIEFYVNDAALNRFVSLRRSRNNLARMIDDLSARLPHAQILVMAMNPLSGIRGLIRPFLDRYIAAHRQVAEAKRIAFIDHRPAWSGLSTEELSAAIPDGGHPLPEASAAIMVPRLLSHITAGACPGLANGVGAGAQTRRSLR